MAEEQAYVLLSNGIKMPAVALGTWTEWKGKEAVLKNAVKEGLGCGMRHVDTAYVYKNEHLVGQAIKEAIDKNSVAREDVFVTTKLWCTFHDADKVRQGLEESLRNLGLDYVDLLLIHWPHSLEYDESCKMFGKFDENGLVSLSQANVYTDTWPELEKLYDAGLVKAIGLSNFNSKQIQKILDICRVQPHVLQVEIHPYFSQQPLVSFCQERGINVMAYGPLASPGGEFSKRPDDKIFDNPILKELAKKNDRSVSQVVLRWIIQRGLSVAVKSVTPARIIENFQLWDFQLNDEDMNTISKLNRNFRIFTEDFAKHHKEWPFGEDF